MKLRTVTIAGVRDAWPYVRKGLDAMLEKYPDRWIPEDVFCELRTGQAFLYIIDNESEELGFLVVKNYHDFDGLVLFVWIMYSNPGSMKENGNGKDILDELDALARAIGAKRIRYHSPRGGFEQFDAFELKMHIYEREV